MSTISRAEASRVNGAKSSGPTTEEGRATSSQNALKLGIFSKKRLLSDEDPAEYEAFVQAFQDYFNPATLIEQVHVDRMVTASWRQKRLERAEVAVTEIQRNAFIHSTDDHKWREYGGQALAVKIRGYGEDVTRKFAPERDALVLASLSIPHEVEKFVRLGASLNREFNAALRAFREEQSRRVETLPVERAAELVTTSTAPEPYEQ
jgi:hypothetical protein